MFIQIQETPNPQSIKFIPNPKRTITESAGIHFGFFDDVAGVKLAAMLFKLDGVVGVFFGPDFITITKRPEMDWAELKVEVLNLLLDTIDKPGILPIAEHKNSSKNSPNNYNKQIDGELVKQIKAIIEERIQPAVAQDGGNIVFRDFQDGVVYLEMQGACAGCPSSTITLKNGIENMLKHYIPEILSVESC